MQILETTTTDKKKLYQMTKGAGIARVQDNDGKTIVIQNYVLYEDTKANGDVMTILSVEDVDGNIFATNSPTFKESFADIGAICGDTPEMIVGETIRIESGTSKAGRKFFTCVWA